MSVLDWGALALFFLIWFGYEPILRRFGHGPGMIATDLTIVRRAWMRLMVTRRDTRLLDGQLLGHVLGSASFFTSSNLILLAGIAGALFGGHAVYTKAAAAHLAAVSLPHLQLKLALILAALARGLLNFIWSIRQINYCVALIGAAPDRDTTDPELLHEYAEAAGEVLNPALSSFSQGVRGYYFALSAAAWLFGPVVFAVGTLAALGLLVSRQSSSRSARAVRRIRALLEE